MKHFPVGKKVSLFLRFSDKNKKRIYMFETVVGSRIQKFLRRLICNSVAMKYFQFSLFNEAFSQLKTISPFLRRNSRDVFETVAPSRR